VLLHPSPPVHMSVCAQSGCVQSVDHLGGGQGLYFPHLMAPGEQGWACTFEGLFLPRRLIVEVVEVCANS
jgi:hypothetical protein